MAKKEKAVDAQVETQTETQASATPAETKAPTVVTMEDGLEVSFRSNSRVNVSCTDSETAIELRVNVINGKFVTYSQPVPAETVEMARRFLAHGLEAKFRDVAAGVKDADDIYNAVADLRDAINSGKWGRVQESSGAEAKDNSMLFKAVCLAMPNKAPEAVRAWLAGKSQEERKALRQQPALAPHIQKVKELAAKEKAEKLAQKSDGKELAALLGDL